MERRRQYPVDEKGVPIRPTNLTECYDICLRGIRGTNRHHLAFQRNMYKSPIERNYRESQIMQVVGSCCCKHSDLHATYLPPRKPDQQAMLDVIQGDHMPTESEVYIRPRNEGNCE